MTTGPPLRNKEWLSPSDKAGQKHFCKQACQLNDKAFKQDFSRDEDQSLKEVEQQGARSLGDNTIKKILTHPLRKQHNWGPISSAWT